MRLPKYQPSYSASGLSTIGILLILGGIIWIAASANELQYAMTPRLGQSGISAFTLLGFYGGPGAISFGILLLLVAIVVSAVNRVADQVRQLHVTTYFLAHPDEIPAVDESSEKPQDRGPVHIGGRPTRF